MNSDGQEIDALYFTIYTRLQGIPETEAELTRFANMLEGHPLAAAGAMGTSLARLGTDFDVLTEKFKRGQPTIENAYVGIAGATDMASDAAHRAALATDEERIAFDKLIGSANAAALAHQRLAEGASLAAVAQTETAAAIANVEPATATSFGGMNRLIRSLDSLALSSVGVHGPLSTIATSLGLLGVGSSVMIGVAAGAATIAVAWELLTGKATKLREETDKLIATMVKSEEVRLGITPAKDFDETTKAVEDLTRKLAAAKQAVADYNSQPVFVKAQGASAAQLAAEVENLQKKLDLATVAQGGFSREVAKGTDAGAQRLELLRAEASGHALSAAQLSVLTTVYADYSQRVKQAEDALALLQVGTAAYGAAAKDVVALIGQQSEAHRLLESQLKLTTKAATDELKSKNDFIEAGLRDAAETLKASGDLIGAAKAELAADLLKIAAKDQLLGQSLKMRQSTIDAMILEDQHTASLKAQVTIGELLATKQREWAALQTGLAQAAAADTTLQARLDGDAAAAFIDAAAAKIAKIDETTQKAIASTAANKTMTVDEKYWADVILMVTGNLEKQGVNLQLNIDLQKTAAGVAHILADEQAKTYIAMLKYEGDTEGALKATHDLRIADANFQIQSRTDITQAVKDELKAQNALQQGFEDATGAAGKMSTAMKTEYRDLATGIKSIFETTFTDITTKGLDSFGNMFQQIEKLFVKMIGQLIAVEAEKKLIEPLAQSLGLVPEGPNNFKGTGLPLSQIANADASAGISTAAAGVGIGVALIGIVSSVVDAAAKLAAARLKWEQSATAFDLTLADFATSIETVAGSLSAALQASARTIDGYNKSAFGVFTSAPGTSGTTLSGLASQAAGVYERSGTEGLKALEDFMRFVAEHTGKLKDTNAAIEQLNKDLGLTAEAAAKLAAADLAAWIKKVDDAYTASLPVIGSAMTTVNTIVADTKAKIADALKNDQLHDVVEIQKTEINQLTTAFGGMTAATLDALISSGQLKDEVLDLAVSMDAAKHAAEDLAATQRNNTTIGGLDSRLAAATATSDPAASAAYSAEARRQVERDELTKAQAQLDADLAAHAGEAVIAQDAYIISLTKTTQALEDAAALEAAVRKEEKLATDQTNAQTSAKGRIAAATGDTAGVQVYADLAEKEKEASDYAAALAAGFDQVTASMIVTADQTEYTAAAEKKAAALALAQANAKLSLQARLDIAQGNAGGAAAITRSLTEAAEVAQAVAAGFDAATIAMIHTTQAAEDLKTANDANAAAAQKYIADTNAATLAAQQAAQAAAAQAKAQEQANNAIAASAVQHVKDQMVLFGIINPLQQVTELIAVLKQGAPIFAQLLGGADINSTTGRAAALDKLQQYFLTNPSPAESGLLSGQQVSQSLLEVAALLKGAGVTGTPTGVNSSFAVNQQITTVQADRLGGLLTSMLAIDTEGLTVLKGIADVLGARYATVGLPALPTQTTPSPGGGTTIIQLTINGTQTDVGSVLSPGTQSNIRQLGYQIAQEIAFTRNGGAP